MCVCVCVWLSFTFCLSPGGQTFCLSPKDNHFPHTGEGGGQTILTYGGGTKLFDTQGGGTNNFDIVGGDKHFLHMGWVRLG